ncbi:MAG: hypothetical protein JST01_24940 [Cyanobacteria bacterium SZAS TMP-1]|nr:hypothetical protein [Cyanobacteria bacterium SZAS TMP-1]
MNIQEDYVRAGSPDTPVTDLRKLAKSSDVAVRRRVAENDGTPADALELLAHDSKPEVRIAVGLSRFAPENIVTQLVKDEQDDVRYWLSSAGYLPLKLLEQLSVDSNPYVADRAQHTLARLGAPCGRLINVFELLSQDHGVIMNKLRTLIQNYADWPKDQMSQKTSEVLDDIREHLERRHTLCDNWFDADSGLPDAISQRCLIDQKSIIEKTSCLLAHGLPQPDFVERLDGLLDQIKSHREFIEDELFVEIKKLAPQKEIEAIKERLDSRAA